MKTETANYAEASSKDILFPRYVIALSFSDDHTDVTYLTSHNDCQVPPGVAAIDRIDGCIMSISGQSQRISPDTAQHTIGSLSFELLDVNGELSAKIKTKRDAGEGIRRKRVVLYKGHESLTDWADYSKRLTYLVDNITSKDRVYTLQTSDIQRSTKEKIFNVHQAVLTTNIAATETGPATIAVTVANGEKKFPVVAHHLTHEDHPEQFVGYIQIDDEIMAHTGWSDNSYTELTLLTDGGGTVIGRGVFGTLAVAHENPTGTTSSAQNKKVEEYVVLSLPAPQCIYSMLTGLVADSPNLIGDVDSFTALGDVVVTKTDTLNPVNLNGMWRLEDASTDSWDAVRSPLFSDGHTPGDVYTAQVVIRDDKANSKLLSIRLYLTNNTYAEVRLTMSTGVSSSAASAGMVVDKWSAKLISGYWVLSITGHSTLGTDAGVHVYLYPALSSPASVSTIEVFNPVLMKGNHFGGGFLPSHWHLGISPEYVDRQAFENIGYDLWDTDTHKGRYVRFHGIKDIAGKSFIEKELLLWMACFMPVHADGSYGLQRFGSVLPYGLGYSAHLTTSQIISYGELTYDQTAVINNIALKWNWVEPLERYTKEDQLIDTVSISRYGYATRKDFEFKGVFTGLHSDQIVRSYFDQLRDRYSAPPLKLKIEVLPEWDKLEVGELVRVTIPYLQDNNVGGTLDRVFEIQGITTDWVTGKGALDLFGGVDQASHSPLTTTLVMEDSYYTDTSNGEIDLASVLTIDGGTNTVTANGTLNGGPTLGDSVYYYDGDLTIGDAATITITGNVTLKIKGGLTINGEINGVGGGMPGGVAPAYNGSDYQDSVIYPLWETFGPQPPTGGLSGGIGWSGGNAWTRYSRLDSFRIKVWGGSRLFGKYVAADQPKGIKSVSDLTFVNNNGTSIEGLLQHNLTGVGGASGSALLMGYYNSELERLLGKGGDGGTGGAGLAIVCRGISFGVGDKINLSGTAGTAGTSEAFSSPGYTTTFHATPGIGGSPGGCIILIDGSISSAPATSNFVLQRGDTPQASADYIVPYDEFKSDTYPPPVPASLALEAFNDVTSQWTGWYGGAHLLIKWIDVSEAGYQQYQADEIKEVTGYENKPTTWSALIDDGLKPQDAADVTKLSHTFTFYYQTAQDATPTPDLIAGDGTYNFSTKAVTPPAGWGLVAPTSGAGKVWAVVTTFHALTAAATTDDGTNTFTAPFSGYSLGADVTKLLKSAIFYYQTPQAATPTALTTGSGTYNFSTKVMTPPAGWGLSPPTSGSGKVWQVETTFYALTAAATTDDGTNTFTSPVSGYSLGATQGATWGTDVNNRPAELTDGRIPAALTSAGYLLTGAYFGGSTMSVEDQLLTIPGAQLSKNPEFRNGISGYSVYDNASTGLITLSEVADDLAPNGSGKILRVTRASGTGTSPGLGGFAQLLNGPGETTAGLPSIPGRYAANTKLLFRMWCKFPVGYNIREQSNATGGGTHTWLTSTAGTGDWALYAGIRTVGTTTPWNSTGHKSLSGPTTGYVWDIASYDQIDITSTASQFLGSNLFDSAGNLLSDSSVLNINATWANIAANGGAGIPAAGATVNTGALANSSLPESAVTNANVSLTTSGSLTGAGGGTINALNLLNGPAQAGADVTGSNTSADTAAVGGIAAATVRDNAANAKTAVDGMSSDLIFSSAEKATYRLQWEGMQANYFNIIAQATTYGIQAETAFTDFTTARNNLSTYLFTTQNIDAGIATAITGDLLAVYTQAFYEKMTLAVNRLTNTNSSIDLDAVTGMKVIRVKQPVGAVMSMSGNPITGAIIVTLPVGWSANMVRFAIDVYNYGGSKSFTLNVSGYTYPGSGAGGYWVNTTADIVGNLASDNRVRFMYNNVTNKAVIVIGSVTADGTASSWTHPSASVRDLHVSWNGGPTTIAQWESGWGIHISDSLTDYPLRPAANPDYSDALLDAANLKGEGPLAKSDLTEAQVTNANLVLNSNGTLSGGSVSSAAINALNLLNGPAHAGATLGSTVAQLSGSFDQVKWDSVLGSAKIKTAQIELLNVTNALLAADISADKITAGTVTGRTIQTDVSPNKRMEMSSTTDHLRFYTDATTVYAEIGYKLDGTDYVVGDFGNTSAANAAVGIRARSYNKHAISAYSLNGYAGVFQSATGDGISVTGAEIGARFTSTARQGIISQSGLDDGIWGVALTVGKVGVYGNGPGAGVGGFSSEVGVKGVSAKIGAYGYSTGVAGIGLKAENVAATGTSLQIVPDVSSDTPYASSPAGSVHIPNNQNYATLKLNGVNRRLATDVITCRLNSTGTSLVGTTGQLVGFGYARYGLGIYYIEVPGWGADFTISIQVSRNTYAYPVVSYRNPTTGYFEFKLFDPVTGGGVDCNTEITLVRD